MTKYSSKEIELLVKTNQSNQPAGKDFTYDMALLYCFVNFLQKKLSHSRQYNAKCTSTCTHQKDSQMGVLYT